VYIDVRKQQMHKNWKKRSERRGRVGAVYINRHQIRMHKNGQNFSGLCIMIGTVNNSY
jgi:hypothetical protein